MDNQQHDYAVKCYNELCAVLGLDTGNDSSHKKNLRKAAILMQGVVESKIDEVIADINKKKDVLASLRSWLKTIDVAAKGTGPGLVAGEPLRDGDVVAQDTDGRVYKVQEFGSVNAPSSVVLEDNETEEESLPGSTCVSGRHGRVIPPPGDPMHPSAPGG